MRASYACLLLVALTNASPMMRAALSAGKNTFAAKTSSGNTATTAQQDSIRKAKHKMKVEYTSQTAGNEGGHSAVAVKPVMDDDPPAPGRGGGRNTMTFEEDDAPSALKHHRSSPVMMGNAVPSIPTAAYIRNSGVNPFGKTFEGSDEAVDSVLNFDEHTVESPTKTYPDLPDDCGQYGEITVEADEVIRKRCAPHLMGLPDSRDLPTPNVFDAMLNKSLKSFDDHFHRKGLDASSLNSALDNTLDLDTETTVDELQTDTASGKLPSVLRNVAMKRINQLKGKIEDLTTELKVNRKEMENLRVFTKLDAASGAANAPPAPAAAIPSKGEDSKKDKESKEGKVNKEEEEEGDEEGDDEE